MKKILEFNNILCEDGGLQIKEKDGLFFWNIPSSNDKFDDAEFFEEIPESLYYELKKWHEANEDIAVFKNTKRYAQKNPFPK